MKRLKARVIRDIVFMASVGLKTRRRPRGWT